MTPEIDYAQLSSDELLLLVTRVYLEMSIRVGHEGAKLQLMELIATGKIASWPHDAV